MSKLKGSQHTQSQKRSQRLNEGASTSGMVGLNSSRRNQARDQTNSNIPSSNEDDDMIPPTPSTRKASRSSNSTVRVTRSVSSSNTRSGRLYVSPKKHTSVVRPTTSSPSKTMSPMKSKREETEMNKLVHDCVYFLLISDQKKHAIKKTDIVRNVLKNKGKLFSRIIVDANVMLQNVFGIEIIELGNRKGQFMLSSLHDTSCFSEFSESETEHMGLLFLILTLIFMNDKVMSEEQLWKTLKKLGIDNESTKSHPTFGNVKKYITNDLVKQLYLEYIRISDSDPPSYEFRWGDRAKVEVNKAEMLDFVSNIYDVRAEDWTSQYLDAQKQTEESSTED